MPDDDLQGFGVDALDAVTMAELEARDLGHDRVGTEHLLLGLLANDDDPAARPLLAAGVTLGAARHKVSEAVGPGAVAGSLPVGPLPKSARAARALSRAVRFSHARRADAVATEHVLLGVLDVEGTAGQVLRGLGVDIERLRSSFAADADLDADAEGESPDSSPEPSGPTCPACRASLDDELRYDLVMATDGRGGSLDVLVFTCGACGRTLGVAPG
jgi:ATP-dependent Clp protease ATP-binding subunit ClpC